MADEMLPPSDEAGAPETPSQVEAPAPQLAQAPTTANEEKPVRPWGGLLFLLALAAVVSTVVGLFLERQDEPKHLWLGLGLLLWGSLDLLAQRRGLVKWRGAKAVVGNLVNLMRALALVGLGAWLALMGLGMVTFHGTAVVTTAGISILVGYLGIALGLEASVKGLRLTGQALLLLALALMYVSYLYFSIPFTFSWASVFATLAFAAAAWSAFRGALDENPALARAVMLVVLLLGAPLATFAIQQMFLVEEQPLFTPTLLIPRMRRVVRGVSPEAGQIKWAPMHTQSAQPGDILYSDKVAFSDRRGEKSGIGLFQQQEDGLGQLSWVETGEDTRLTGFSQDGKLLAFTAQKPGDDAPSLSVLEPAADQAAVGDDGSKAYYELRTIYQASTAPGPVHGQVWRNRGTQLYFSGPASSPKSPEAKILREDLTGHQYSVLRKGRGYPAISPDGQTLVSVGFLPDEIYLEMADGFNGGENPRRFDPLKERAYFPAWNAAQTRTLFIKKNRLMIMHSNGTRQEPFRQGLLESRLWYTHSTAPFTLQFKHTGDRYRIYRARPDGRQETLVFAAVGHELSPPQWSADSKRIGFVLRDDQGSSIYTVNADGTWPRRFFQTEDVVRNLQWSPDGSRLAWICDRSPDNWLQGLTDMESQELWTAGYEGLDPERRILSRGHLSCPSWAPDGKRIAVQETSSWSFLGWRLVNPDLNNVLVADLTDQHVRVMTRYGIMARQPAFSPQGVAVAYFTDQRPWAPGLASHRLFDLVISQLY
jgi:Tol biopolymer transport system component